LRPYTDPERTLERLRRNAGAPASVAAAQLPLVRRALRSSPQLRNLLLAAVKSRLEREAREFRAQAELKDRRWLNALAPLLEHW